MQQFLKFITWKLKIKNYYLTFMYSWTCFERPHAHHPELNKCSSNLWFYRWSVVVAVLLVVVGPAGVRTPETCWAVHKRQVKKTWEIVASSWLIYWKITDVFYILYYVRYNLNLTILTKKNVHYLNLIQNNIFKIFTLRRLMSHIYGAPILDVSRSYTTTQHSR